MSGELILIIQLEYPKESLGIESCSFIVLSVRVTATHQPSRQLFAALKHVRLGLRSIVLQNLHTVCWTRKQPI
jgi:hypothetical protein